jgi:hypothetical protein
MGLLASGLRGAGDRASRSSPRLIVAGRVRVVPALNFGVTREHSAAKSRPSEHGREEPVTAEDATRSHVGMIATSLGTSDYPQAPKFTQLSGSVAMPPAPKGAESRDAFSRSDPDPPRRVIDHQKATAPADIVAGKGRVKSNVLRLSGAEAQRAGDVGGRFRVRQANVVVEISPRVTQLSFHAELQKVVHLATRRKPRDEVGKPLKAVRSRNIHEPCPARTHMEIGSALGGRSPREILTSSTQRRTLRVLGFCSAVLFEWFGRGNSP